MACCRERASECSARASGAFTGLSKGAVAKGAFVGGVVARRAVWPAMVQSLTQIMLLQNSVLRDAQKGVLLTRATIVSSMRWLKGLGKDGIVIQRATGHTRLTRAASLRVRAATLITKSSNVKATNAGT